jgi:hypothetical protein
MRNHAQLLVACDFFTVVTARFRILYVFVVMELGRRQIRHFADAATTTHNEEGS